MSHRETYIVCIPLDSDPFTLVHVVQHIVEQDGLLLHLFQLVLGLCLVIGLLFGFLRIPNVMCQQTISGQRSTARCLLLRRVASSAPELEPSLAGSLFG